MIYPLYKYDIYMYTQKKIQKLIYNYKTPISLQFFLTRWIRTDRPDLHLMWFQTYNSNERPEENCNCTPSIDESLDPQTGLLM